MSDVTRDQVVDFLSHLSVVELSELVRELEESWGVEAATSVVATPSSLDSTAVLIDDEDEKDVTLTGFGDKKIQVIKAVRGITGLGIKDAKALVDGAPTTLKEGISKAEAIEIIEQIEQAGGQAMIT